MQPPDGFTYSLENDECVIAHQRTGMVSLNVFLIVFLLWWSFFAALLTRGYLLQHAGLPTNSDRIPIYAPIFCCVACMITAFFLTYSLFARKVFRLLNEELSIETRLLGVSWNARFPRASITEVKQVVDGGHEGRTIQERDSFPSHGLVIRSGTTNPPISSGTDGHFVILHRQSYDHSAWLGDAIAQWAGLEFYRCPKPAEPSDAPKDRASRIDNGNYNAGPR